MNQNRQTWQGSEIEALLDLPFNDLIYRAQTVHRQHFDPNKIQLSTLISIKTGGCAENCKYCSQSARNDTEVDSEPTLPLEEVLQQAMAAKNNGSTRFCMSAAWRGPKKKDLSRVVEMIREVRKLGMETCATLGLLQEGQAEELRAAGLDYYNHNLDTAAEAYGEIISSRTYEDRLDTLARVRKAGINVCCGGIVGMGESRRIRATFIAELANLDPQPESVPINHLVQIEGTPLYGTEILDPLEFVRTIAAARIALPKSLVRLSAGRMQMSEHVQALCFLAGANSIFYGEKLLTTANPEMDRDRILFSKLGLEAM